LSEALQVFIGLETVDLSATTITLLLTIRQEGEDRPEGKRFWTGLRTLPNVKTR
jgi:hypothetical protein